MHARTLFLTLSFSCLADEPGARKADSAPVSIMVSPPPLALWFVHRAMGRVSSVVGTERVHTICRWCC